MGHEATYSERPRMAQSGHAGWFIGSERLDVLSRKLDGKSPEGIELSGLPKLFAESCSHPKLHR
jgi:hypothetical protein